MYKLLRKVVAGLGTGLLAFVLLVIIIVAWVSVGALVWGWLIMVIAGATGHSIGYGDAFLWGYIPAILTGS